MRIKIFIAIIVAIVALGASCSKDDEDRQYEVGDYYSRSGVTGIVYKITNGGNTV